MWINTRNTQTGQYAMYPEHFLELFPNLERADDEEHCVDCVVNLEDSPIEVFQIEDAPVTPADLVDLKEPTPPKRKIK